MAVSSCLDHILEADRDPATSLPDSLMLVSGIDFWLGPKNSLTNSNHASSIQRPKIQTSNMQRPVRQGKASSSAEPHGSPKARTAHQRKCRTAACICWTCSYLQCYFLRFECALWVKLSMHTSKYKTSQECENALTSQC